MLIITDSYYEKAELLQRQNEVLRTLFMAATSDEIYRCEIDYTNWKGNRRNRNIQPVGLYYGTTEYHKEPQWLLSAIDSEDDVSKDFALKDIHSVKAVEYAT